MLKLGLTELVPKCPWTSPHLSRQIQALSCFHRTNLWILSMLSPVLTHKTVISTSFLLFACDWLLTVQPAWLLYWETVVCSAALPRTDSPVSSYFPVHNLWISWKFVSYVNTPMFKNDIILFFIAFLMPLGTSMLGHRLFRSMVLHFQAIENFLYHCFLCIFHSQNVCQFNFMMTYLMVQHMLNFGNVPGGLDMMETATVGELCHCQDLHRCWVKCTKQISGTNLRNCSWTHNTCAEIPFYCLLHWLLKVRLGRVHSWWCICLFLLSALKLWFFFRIFYALCCLPWYAGLLKPMKCYSIS